MAFRTCSSSPTECIMIQHAIDQSNGNIIKLWNGVGFRRCEVGVTNGIILLRRHGNASIYMHSTLIAGFSTTVPGWHARTCDRAQLVEGRRRTDSDGKVRGVS